MAIDWDIVGNIASAVGGLFGAGSSVANTLIGAGSTEEGRRWASKESEINRQFQERMANTALQRYAADARAANINKLYGISGASSPAGGVTSAAPGFSSNIDLSNANMIDNIQRYMQNKANIDSTRENTKLAKENQKIANEQQKQINEQIKNLSADRNKAIGELGLITTQTAQNAEDLRLKREENNAIIKYIQEHPEKVFQSKYGDNQGRLGPELDGVMSSQLLRGIGDAIKDSRSKTQQYYDKRIRGGIKFVRYR